MNGWDRREKKLVKFVWFCEQKGIPRALMQYFSEKCFKVDLRGKHSFPLFKRFYLEIIRKHENESEITPDEATELIHEFQLIRSYPNKLMWCDGENLLHKCCAHCFAPVMYLTGMCGRKKEFNGSGCDKKKQDTSGYIFPFK